MSDRLRILQVVGDPVGGIRKHIHDILNGLNDEFDFFYISSRNGDSVYFSEIEQLSKKIGAYETLAISKKPSLSDITNIIKIYKFIRKHKIDLVHGHGAKGGLYSRIAGKLAGCKVVYTPHGGVVHSMFGRFEDKIYRIMERFLCSFTDMLIFESKYTQDAFQKKIGCKKRIQYVNYNGVEVPEQNLCPNYKMNSGPTKRIGVFGLIREVKGQHLALDAIVELLEDGYNLELHFFGDGPLKILLEEKVRLLGYESNIVFHGEVSDVPCWLKTVDFVLIPSLFESFGYIAIEAIFSGKTVISSDVGGLSEILDEDFAFMFKVGCKDSMKEQICLAINTSSREISRMNELALNRSKGKFEIASMLQGLKSKYGKLCEY